MRDCTSGLSALPASTPTRRIDWACCARAASGHAAAAPPSSVMNSRRSFDHLVGEQRATIAECSMPIDCAVLKLITSSNLVG